MSKCLHCHALDRMEEAAAFGSTLAFQFADSVFRKTGCRCLPELKDWPIEPKHFDYPYEPTEFVPRQGETIEQKLDRIIELLERKS